MKTILAIDQGTSSTRARLYSLKGDIVCTSQTPLLTQRSPSGWVEQEGEAIWQSVLKVLQDIQSQNHDFDIVACGIANQRETSLLWQRSTGTCLGPAIVWQDSRTADWCASFSQHQASIQQKTGLILAPYFSASKIAWMLEQYPSAKALLAADDLAFGTVDSFLLWKLSLGRCHKTDVTNASRTMLYNIHTLDWDEDLLKLFSIPRCILPEVMPCDHLFSTIPAELFGYEIPISGVVGDQQAALLGQSLYEKGMIKSTYGTGGFLLMNIGDKPLVSTHKLLTTIAYQIGDSIAYGLEGSIYQAGTMIQWLRDSLGILNCAAESEELAASLESNGGLYFLPAFTGLAAPYWQTEPGARIHGLTLKTNRAHFARAALEAVVYQTLDVLDCMVKDSNIHLKMMRIDGGMVENNWLAQRLADQCQLTVQRPVDCETTAYGAAMLAALGAGIYDSLQSTGEHWQLDRCFEPDHSYNQSLKNDYAGWKKIVKSYTRDLS